MAQVGSTRILFLFEDEIRAAAEELDVLYKALAANNGESDDTTAKQIQVALQACFTALHGAHEHPNLMLTSGDRMFKISKRVTKVEDKKAKD